MSILRLLKNFFCYLRAIAPKNNKVYWIFFLSTLLFTISVIIKSEFEFNFFIIYLLINVVAYSFFYYEKPIEIELEEHFSLNQKIQELSQDDFDKLKKIYTRFWLKKRLNSQSQIASDVYDPISDLWDRIVRDEDMTILSLLIAIRKMDQ